MPIRRVLQAACLVASVLMLQAYEYGIEENYPDPYHNEIDEEDPNLMEAPTDPPSGPCSAPEFNKWDKLFTMLENSQMKENMLLQYSDDIVKVGLQSLRAEVLELMAQSSGSCAAAVEGSARRAGAYAEAKLQQALDHLKDHVIKHQSRQEEALQQIVEASREQAVRLDKVESSCLDGRVKSLNTRHLEQENRDVEDKGRLARSLQAMSEDLQSLREHLVFYTQAMASKIVPAGCDTALFFPMRSSRTYAEVIPQNSMQSRAFTMCLWAKPTQVLNKTVLFSYGTDSNPLELQLLLSKNSALFTVGGETHLVVAQDAIEEGRWVHLCGTWSSEQGLASLWVDGQKVANSPGVAEGHELPDGGVAVLGQEYAGEGLAKRFGFQETFNADEGFTGKISGVNAWDRVLSEEKIVAQARVDGRSCGARGNLVAWGVSQFLEKGGVKLIY
ncbi:pentraxin-related protein PTX3 [Trichomycterus rosablanca]|uniref:pentraxin-related protein PTX3 n=1 Tax=Trichomycterus rosablanca TaxID=2290929 RepID=UPI002F35058F